MITKVSDLIPMVFQGAIAMAAEITICWKYSDELKADDDVASIRILGVNKSGEHTIDSIALYRVGEDYLQTDQPDIIKNTKDEYVGTVFKTLTKEEYTHIYAKLDTNGTNCELKDITFHNVIFPKPDSVDSNVVSKISKGE